MTPAFRQWDSWRNNVNYAYPPGPMTGRLVTFLPRTESRAIVCFPAPVPHTWWSYAVQPAAAGVIASLQIGDFIIVAFDFRTA